MDLGRLPTIKPFLGPWYHIVSYRH